MVRDGSVVRSYLHKHAADPNWLYSLREKKWISAVMQVPEAP